MSTRGTVHESLPYIDAEPTAAERAAAESLIAAELSSTSTPTPDQSSRSLAPLRSPNFSALMASELARVESKQPLKAIDLARYEAASSEEEPTPTTRSGLQTSLSRAYTSAAYLTQRRAHLALLESYGKNAWLVGNWQLEGELRALERELEATKKEMDLVNLDRRRTQDEVGGELRLLEESWRRGVGKVLETEVAVEGVKREVRERERQRQMAG